MKYHHKFDPRNKKILDSSERKKELNPYKILKDSNLKKRMTFVDIGAGTGFFTIPGSKIVGEKGKVFALDIEEKMLNEIKRKIKVKKIKNVTIKKSKEYNFPLESGIADFVLLAFVLHEVKNKMKFLKEVKRILKRDGLFCIIEWKKKKTAYGPPFSIRLSRREIKNYIKKAGFSIKKETSLKNKYNLLLCLKS